MIRKLTRHGDGLALVLEPGVLDLLRIDTRTPLEISTDGRMIFICPVRDAEQFERFHRALESVLQEYGGVFKALAE